MSSTTQNPPHLQNDELSSLNKNIIGRNYGLLLGVLTAIYCTIINLTTDMGAEEGFGVPLGLRFAKHIFIVPIVWIAIASYAKTLPDGRIFKDELGLLGRIAVWASAVIILANILLFAIRGFGFEQFLEEGGSFMSVMVTSGYLLFETVVFVMILGFVILQAYKGSGSPED